MLPAFFLALVVVIYYANKMMRLTQKMQEYKLDAYRQQLEAQIAALSQQLVLTEDRFKQVNHLLLSGQKRSPDPSSWELKVKPSEFLEKMGVDVNAEVQPDLVFVLIPFNPMFDDTYQAIKYVVEESGFRCSRGDSTFTSGEILPEIIRYIVKARLIIAEITGRNPNVFYELGIAHALGKQVLILSQVDKDIPFDVANIRVLTYENQDDLRSRLRSWIVHTLARLR
jgi:hypothetical protein